MMTFYLLDGLLFPEGPRQSGFKSSLKLLSPEDPPRPEMDNLSNCDKAWALLQAMQTLLWACFGPHFLPASAKIKVPV
jgi:hypothetical protein